MRTRDILIVISILIASTLFSERIVDNKNGTVTDKKTGLTWEICDERECSDYDYFDAKERCDALNKVGKKWRLPTQKELVLSYDYEKNSFIVPAYDEANARPYIWSSTDAGSGARFTLGYNDNNYTKVITSKIAIHRVNCVSGQEYRSYYVDNKNGTVTDKQAKLIWQKCSIGQNNDYLCSGQATVHSWEDAIEQCKNLKLAGKKWRLPTLHQLLSLVDYKRNANAPFISEQFFPNIQSNYYWSSSTYAQPTSSACYVNFNYGGVHYNAKTYNYYVRCVTDP